MSTLREARDHFDRLIQEYGEDYNIAYFFITEGELQDCHLEFEEAEAAGEPSYEPKALSRGAVIAALKHMEEDGLAYAKLQNPMVESLDAAYHWEEEHPS
jgi:hypothetical protein